MVVVVVGGGVVGGVVGIVGVVGGVVGVVVVVDFVGGACTKPANSSAVLYCFALYSTID